MPIELRLLASASGSVRDEILGGQGADGHSVGPDDRGCGTGVDVESEFVDHCFAE